MNDKDEFSQQMKHYQLLLWLLAGINLDFAVYHAILAWAENSVWFFLAAMVNGSAGVYSAVCALRSRRLSKQWDRVTRTYQELVATIESEHCPSRIYVDHVCEQYEAAIKEALKK